MSKATRHELLRRHFEKFIIAGGDNDPQEVSKLEHAFWAGARAFRKVSENMRRNKRRKLKKS